MPDAMNDAVRLGRGNQHVVGLTRAHCRHTEFVLSPLGGRGLAESSTALSIDARSLRCPTPRRPRSAGQTWN